MTIASTMLLVAVIISACQQPYSTPPAVTNTPLDPNSFFSTPIPDQSQPDSMNDVENFTTPTALAGNPNANIPTATPGTGAQPADGATVTATPIIALNPTATATQAVSVVVTSTTGSTTTSSGPRPTSYILKNGEFPYCIARRYNVDPDELLRLSGLSAGILYPPGTSLTIPQSGSFPENRMLKTHPASYTVVSSDETVYSVACLYGDVKPEDIATANGISVDTVLASGKVLSIP